MSPGVTALPYTVGLFKPRGEDVEDGSERPDVNVAVVRAFFRQVLRETPVTTEIEEGSICGCQQVPSGWRP